MMTTNSQTKSRPLLNRMNLANTIIPKSDQLNSDDLIAGPRTIKITEIRAGSAPEQPVSISYEGDNGRPYKPCKSMRRLLISIWGDESTVYIGRRLTLFRDPSVRFGSDETGGIRISHASNIERETTLALTVTRGKRKPYTVLPLKDEAPVDLQSLSDIGDSKAGEGMDALGKWWATLPAAAKKSLKGKLDTEWKPKAEGKAA
jgi:hypothetical protein